MTQPDDFTQVTPAKKRTPSKPRKLTTAARNETLSQLKDEFTPSEKAERLKTAKMDSKRYRENLLTALAEQYPVEAVVGLLDTAVDLSIETRSWKGLIKVAELLLQYSLGRPRQVTQSTSLDINELLRQLQDAEQPRIIDVEAVRKG